MLFASGAFLFCVFVECGPALGSLTKERQITDDGVLGGIHLGVGGPDRHWRHAGFEYVIKVNLQCESIEDACDE